jgi:hypothetical protein
MVFQTAFAVQKWVAVEPIIMSQHHASSCDEALHFVPLERSQLRAWLRLEIGSHKKNNDFVRELRRSIECVQPPSHVSLAYRADACCVSSLNFCRLADAILAIAAPMLVDCVLRLRDDR